VDGRLDDLLDALRHQGERVTPARRAVVEALVAADGHLGAEDLVDRAQRSVPSVHRATIYRTLDTLERLGVVVHVHLGHGRAAYHLSDDVHQHLVCEVCGDVTEAPPRLFDAVARRLLKSDGFAMRPYHFAVVGRCARCQELDAEAPDVSTRR
jgi:Fe2+ or Zn2+ uptake regulation protein